MFSSYFRRDWISKRKEERRGKKREKRNHLCCKQSWAQSPCPSPLSHPRMGNSIYLQPPPAFLFDRAQIQNLERASLLHFSKSTPARGIGNTAEEPKTPPSRDVTNLHRGNGSPRVASLVLEDKSWIFRGVEAENRIDLIVFSIRKGRFRRDFQGMLEMCVRFRKGLIAWKRYRSVEIDSTRDISALVGSLSRG